MDMSKFILLLLVVLLTSFLPNGGLALELCRSLSDLRGINYNIILESNESYYEDGEYFCAPTAPKQFQCRCGFATICVHKNDPWGRNIGYCGCCPTWLIVFFVFFGVFFALSLLTAVYLWACRGKWWCDGYPPPVQPLMCRRGHAIVAPASAPLPPNLFRGYPSADFASDPVGGEAAAAGGSEAPSSSPSRAGGIIPGRRRAGRRGQAAPTETETPAPPPTLTLTERSEEPPEAQNRLSRRNVPMHSSRYYEEV